MSHAAGTMMCVDEEGAKHQHKEKWSKDDCTVCRCRVSGTGFSCMFSVLFEQSLMSLI